MNVFISWADAKSSVIEKPIAFAIFSILENDESVLLLIKRLD